MSQQTATLVFTDRDDGNVGLSLTFDPVVRPSDKPTPAVRAAFDALEAIQRQTSQAKASKGAGDE
jgi:hypothetical protein